jgi:hypothetical protein
MYTAFCFKTTLRATPFNVAVQHAMLLFLLLKILNPERITGVDFVIFH